MKIFTGEGSWYGMVAAMEDASFYWGGIGDVCSGERQVSIGEVSQHRWQREQMKAKV
jgi:hypothetical protein